jgi:hypothetical protein
MDHNEAKTTQATERYLLDEMEIPERDAFEEHFFDCIECAADVKDGAQLVATAGAVMRDDARVVPFRKKTGWKGWLPQAAAAAVVSGVLAGYGAVQFVAPRIASAPRLMVAGGNYELDTGENRAPGEPAPTYPPNVPFILNFYITSNDEAASYVIRVRGNDGKLDLTEPVTRKRAENPVPLVLPALPRGSYEAVIEGVRKDGNRFPITTTPFTVEERAEGS